MSIDEEDDMLMDSQLSATDTAFSDPVPRLLDRMLSQEDEDDWCDNLALTSDLHNGSLGPSSDQLSQTSSPRSLPSSQTSYSRQGQSFSQPSHPPLDLGSTSPALRLESHDLCSQVLSPLVDEALSVTTSHLPIVLDDDLACDSDEDMDSSRAFFTMTPVLSPPPLDAVAVDSELLEFDSEFDVPAQGSLDGCNLSGCSLSLPPQSRLPPVHEPVCVTAVIGNFHHDQQVEAAARLRRLACSVSPADENPSALGVAPYIDGDGDGQPAGRDDGQNEGSLVAGDAGHATVIRAGQGEEACAREGAGAGSFLAEPAGMMLLQWEEFDEGGNEGDMLWFE